MIIKPEAFNKNSIQSLQTTRIGGVSNSPYDGMNMGCFGQDPYVQDNISLLHKKHALPHQPVFMQQTHSDKVFEYQCTPEKHGKVVADACFTRKKHIICAILTADCLPVLLADKSASVVAAIHCGWRSLYADIISKTMTKMDCSADDLQCWLGPCISYQPYRVDEAFRTRFVSKYPQLVHCFYQHKKTGWHADLKKIATAQLETLGINEISQSPFCTYDNRSMFYSYRRDKETGRMATMIWLND